MVLGVHSVALRHKMKVYVWETLKGVLGLNPSVSILSVGLAEQEATTTCALNLHRDSQITLDKTVW